MVPRNPGAEELAVPGEHLVEREQHFGKSFTDRDAYLESTRRFFSTVAGVEVRDLMVDGERACALTRYEVRPPNGGDVFHSEVAEVFSVRKGEIYFDPTPYPG